MVMTLAFSTIFPKGKPGLEGKPTHFIEKIWKGLSAEFYKNEDDPVYGEFFENDLMYDNYNFDSNIVFNESVNAKIHTMRSDEKDRWKKGNDVHFNIWTGKPYNSPTFRFAPIIKCSGTEKIEIKYKNKYLIPEVKINGNKLTKDEIFELAKNDGFDSIGDFLKWFNEDWTGKIIHWTPFRYVPESIHVVDHVEIKGDQEIIPGMTRDQLDKQIGDGIAKAINGKVKTYGNKRLDNQNGLK